MTGGSHQTVVVAALTYKRPEMLARLLESLLTLEHPAGWDVRFLIVDNDPEASARSINALPRRPHSKGKPHSRVNPISTWTGWNSPRFGTASTARSTALRKRLSDSMVTRWDTC